MNEAAYFQQFASWDLESDFADRVEIWLHGFTIRPMQMIPESETTCSAIVTMQDYIDGAEIKTDHFVIADHDTIDINRVELFIWHISEWYQWEARQLNGGAK